MKVRSINSLLEEAIDKGLFPSCAYLVGEQDRILEIGALGRAVVEPELIDADESTIYDLASLTKVLSTGLIASIFHSRKELRLDHKIKEFFPHFKDTPFAETSILSLATHSAGFPAWKPFYAFADKGIEPEDAVLEQIVATERAYPPNEDVIYSDFGFILFGLILEKVFSGSLENAFQELIARPLNLAELGFNPSSEKRNRIAASENGNRFELETCIEKFSDEEFSEADFRDRMIWGEVHDGNCYFLNGVSGHAGLFGDLRSTFKVAQQFLIETTELLDAETVALFERNYTESNKLSRSFAFQLATSKGSTAEDVLPRKAFGHLGFAGTMLWIDPTRERVYMLFSNRTHATELPFPDQADIRKEFLRLAQANYL